MKISVELDDDDVDLAIVYSGYGTQASVMEFFEQQLRHAADHAQRTLQLRYAAAMSGAMRWPWSQEAPIRSGGGPRYG